MPMSGTVSHPSSSDDGRGGQTAGTATTYGPYAMSVRANGKGVPGLLAQGLVASMPYTVRMPYDATVEAGDTIQTATRSYKVLAVRRSENILTALECDCVEVLR